MPKYVHIATHTTVWDTPYDLKRLGQVVELPDDVAALISHAVMPAEDFQSYGLTPDELKRYPTLEALEIAPDETKAKWRAVWEASASAAQKLKPQTQAPEA